MPNQTVYVFTFNNREFNGFSLKEDGANLPILASTSKCTWTLVRAIPMSGTDLKPFARDVLVALVNLRTRGYHIARNTGVVLTLPRLRRVTFAAPSPRFSPAYVTSPSSALPRS